MKSLSTYVIPVKIGGLRVKIKVDVFYSDIPLLLSKSMMAAAGLVVDYCQSTITWSGGRKVEMFKCSTGHMCIPLQSEGVLCEVFTTVSTSA